MVANPLTITYLGPGWGTKALELMQRDPRVQAAVKGTELTVLTRITGAPVGRYHYLYAHFDGKGLAESRMGQDEAELELEGLPAADFIISGPYDVFAAIQRSELSERRAVLSGRLHVKGSRLTALRHMSALEAVTEVLAEIPCRT